MRRRTLRLRRPRRALRRHRRGRAAEHVARGRAVGPGRPPELRGAGRIIERGVRGARPVGRGERPVLRRRAGHAQRAVAVGEPDELPGAHRQARRHVYVLNLAEDRGVDGHTARVDQSGVQRMVEAAIELPPPGGGHAVAISLHVWVPPHRQNAGAAPRTVRRAIGVIVAHDIGVAAAGGVEAFATAALRRAFHPRCVTRFSITLRKTIIVLRNARNRGVIRARTTSKASCRPFTCRRVAALSRRLALRRRV